MAERIYCGGYGNLVISLMGKVIDLGGVSVKIDRDTATVDRTSPYSQLRRLGVFRLMDR